MSASLDTVMVLKAVFFERIFVVCGGTGGGRDLKQESAGREWGASSRQEGGSDSGGVVGSSKLYWR